MSKPLHKQITQAAILMAGGNDAWRGMDPAIQGQWLALAEAAAPAFAERAVPWQEVAIDINLVLSRSRGQSLGKCSNAATQ